MVGKIAVECRICGATQANLTYAQLRNFLESHNVKVIARVGRRYHTIESGDALSIWQLKRMLHQRRK